MAEKLLESLEAGLTNDLLARLVAYAHMKARRKFWYGMFGGPMAKGLEAEDLASNAIKKTIRASAVHGGQSDHRTWDGRRDLFEHLKSVVDSDLNHLATSAANRHLRRAAGFGEGDGGDSLPIVDASDQEYNPEEALLAKEAEQLAEEFFWAFYESVTDDMFLSQVLDRIFDGDERPAEIAASLGVPVEHVYNARKRLRRRLKDFWNHRETTREARNG